MDRRDFIAGLVLLALPLAAEAQQAGKMARIAILGATTPEDLPQWEGFRHGLRERGYVALQVQIIAARDASEIDKAFQLMTRERAEALAVLLTRYSSPRAPRSSPSP